MDINNGILKYLYIIRYILINYTKSLEIKNYNKTPTIVIANLKLTRLLDSLNYLRKLLDSLNYYLI